MLSVGGLRAYIPLIDEKVSEVIDEFADSLSGQSSPQNTWALQAIREYCLRPGKHIRGSLAAATYDHLKGNEKASSEAVLLAVVVELMHNYLLIVDDVMDQSPLRRGLPTMHRLYRRQYPDSSHNEADMMGINIGLIVQHLAGMTMAKLRDDGSAGTLEAVVHRNIAITGFGQMDDVYQTATRKTKPADIITKYQKKSSYYTFVNPLECAYALAGKYSDIVASDCTRYGMPAGVAFQLRDDYVGIFGDSDASGKENLDDIHEGKYTMLVAEALHATGGQNHEQLTSILGDNNATRKDLERVKEIMVQSGSVEAVSRQTDKLVQEAVDAARSATVWSQDFGEFLVELVLYSVRRDS